MGDWLPAVGVHPTATDRSMAIVDLAAETKDAGLAGDYVAGAHSHARSE